MGVTAAADDPVTTVKVPRSLRARIARGAAATGQSAAGFLAAIVDRWEREQAGTRPAVVLSSNGYLDAVPNLAIVVPVTTRERGWPHHVRLSGRDLALPRAGFAMTEQPRTISRDRIGKRVGRVDESTMDAIVAWLKDFLDL